MECLKTSVLLWTLLILPGCVVGLLPHHGRASGQHFEEDFHYHDPHTGEVQILTSRGKFRNFIDLNSVVGLKRVMCVSNTILLAMENSDVVKKWRVGDVITGNDKWECQLGLSHAPDKGIFRKIATIDIKTNTRVDVISVEASFWDLFDHADIFYHHTPPKEGSSNNNTYDNSSHEEVHRREKREPKLDDVLPKNKGFTWNPAYNIGRGVNYDVKADKSGGEFLVSTDNKKNIGFDPVENTWFKAEKNVETDTSKLVLNAELKSKLTCEDCYLYFKAGLTFKLVMDRDKDNKLKFKEYLLSFKASAKLNIDVKLKVTGEFSISYDKRLWRGEVPLGILIPIVPQWGLNLKVALAAELWFSAAFTAVAELEATTGFHSTAEFSWENKKIGDAAATTTTEKKIVPFKAHPPKVDIAAKITGSLSIYPKVEVSVGLAWGLSEFVFEIALLAPVAIGVKPELLLGLEAELVMGSAILGSLDLKLDVNVILEIRPVKLTLAVVGHKWSFNIIPLGFKKTISLLNGPFALIAYQDIFCIGTFSQPPCGKEGTAITKKTDERLSNLKRDDIIFDNDDAHYMSPTMKTKLVKFADMASKIKIFKDRKIMVRGAWSATAKGLAAEGRLLTLGFTEVKSSKQSTDSTLIGKMIKYLSCSGFCKVTKSGNDVEVAVEGESLVLTSKTGKSIITRILTPSDQVLRIYELPVGNGDFTLIQCPDGTVSIVDGITDYESKIHKFWHKQEIVSFLKQEDLNNIRHVFITRGYIAQGISVISAELIEKLNLDIRKKVNLYVSSLEENTQVLKQFSADVKKTKINKCTEPSKCPTLPPICTDVRMEVLASALGTEDTDKGLVLRLVYKTFSMLFIGHLWAATSVNYVQGMQSSVYRLSQHGRVSSWANMKAFLDKVKPIVILSSGDPWRSKEEGKPSCRAFARAEATTSVSKVKNNYVTCYDTVKKKVETVKTTAAVFSHAPTSTTVNIVSIAHNGLTAKTTVDVVKVATASHNDDDDDDDLFRKKRAVNGERFKSATAGGDFPSLTWCKNKFPALSVGKSSPSATNVDVCKPMIQAITRDGERFRRELTRYAMDDMIFSNEEQNENTWCGNANQKCASCSEKDQAKTCQDRIMTTRLLFRLRRLAYLTAQQFENSATPKKLKVIEAWDEPTSKYPKGKHGTSSLHYEGRAAQLELDGGSAADVAILSHLAQCAGFDHVKLATATRLEVCVQAQAGTLGEIVSFQKGANLLVVSVPADLQSEYEYPEEMKSESRKTKLLDGSNSGQPLSDSFTIATFMYPGLRFFRLDERLVECLQETKDIFPNLQVIQKSAYRPRSKNRIAFDARHTEERYRFQTGQAVELKIQSGSKNTLLELSKKLTQVCTSILSSKQMFIGIGAHTDKLYFDIRTKESDSKRMKIWEVGNSGWYKDLESFANQINGGGPIINPVNANRACQLPPFGENLHYITLKTDNDNKCSDENVKFCPNTLTNRQEVEQELETKLKTLLNKRMIPTNDIKKCFVDHCGCGLGIGQTWSNKVTSCINFLKNYVEKANVPFKNPTNVRFYNSDRTNSALHSMACEKGATCLENTQIYSIVGNALNAKFKPVPTESIEEKLYSSRENPSPVNDIAEQMLAMNAKGTVNVYIEDNTDVSALTNIIKILFLYNQNVDHVQFNVASTANKGKLQDALNRKSEFWASGACPSRSRAAITPYSVKDIARNRVKRSIEESAARNMRMQLIHNFEHAWLMKN